MALMLRSQGVPTRIVSGYAGGEFNPEKNVFEVRQNVAHTWVEVYFPGFGWQRFEPTPASYTSVPDRPDAPASEENGGDAGSDAIDSPRERTLDLDELERQFGVTEEQATDSEEVRALIEQREAQQWRTTWARRAVGGVGMVALALVGLAFLWHPRGIGPAALAYSRALTLARWASLAPTTAATPREFATQLGEHLPAQRAALDEIATAYTRERYSGGQPVAPASVENAWRQVRWPLVGTILGRWAGLRRQRNTSSKRRKR
jgi:transglutaminase-like putative cysteine protease